MPGPDQRRDRSKLIPQSLTSSSIVHTDSLFILRKTIYFTDVKQLNLNEYIIKIFTADFVTHTFNYIFP